MKSVSHTVLIDLEKNSGDCKRHEDSQHANQLQALAPTVPMPNTVSDGMFILQKHRARQVSLKLESLDLNDLGDAWHTVIRQGKQHVISRRCNVGVGGRIDREHAVCRGCDR